MLQLEAIEIRVGAFTVRATAEIAPGGRVGLIGASGSGKSTLLSAIAGFHDLASGRVLFDGTDITRHPAGARPMSVLFQEGNLFPHLSVHQNVALGLRPSLRLSADEAALVEDCLSQTGLAGMGSRLPKDLSGGQRSRVALARMILRDRPLALLDEPFSALDPGLRSEMLDVVQALCEARRLTLLMATHDVRDVERLCDRLWFLEDGDLSVDLPVTSVRSDPPEVLTPWL